VLLTYPCLLMIGPEHTGRHLFLVAYNAKASAMASIKASANANASIDALLMLLLILLQMLLLDAITF